MIGKPTFLESVLILSGLAALLYPVTLAPGSNINFESLYSVGCGYIMLLGLLSFVIRDEE